MRIATRFAIAVHVLTLVGLLEEEGGKTSEYMAGSIGVNAVIVRNVSGRLRRAGLIRSKRGVAGAHLMRPLSEIRLVDVYRAVEDNGEIFAIHSRPNPECLVGRGIQAALESVFGEARQAMEDRLAAVTMADVLRDIEHGASPPGFES